MNAASDDAAGCSAWVAYSSIAAPLFAEVWNMLARPPPPRASRLMIAPTRARSGLFAKKCLAPIRPNSSASVTSTIKSRSGCPFALIARTTSRLAATPVVSSAAPGEPQTVSWCDMIITAGSDRSRPGSIPMTLVMVKAAAFCPDQRLSSSSPFVGSGAASLWVSIPSAVIRNSRCRRTSAFSSLPVGCGRAAITRTSVIARPAENAVTGAPAGLGAGGIVA
jgi:hypothetical protein